mgnify:FL=1
MDPKKNPFLNDRLYAFGRMIFPTPAGDRFGVSRVWYKEGHPHAGNCEAELIDGTSVLVPIEDVQVAPNWDVTPEEGRFTGSEFFRPKFLAGATTQDRFRLFSHGNGVLIPGDLSLVRELAGTVEPGWTVKWYSHGCNEFRGDLTIVSADDKGVELKGEKGYYPKRFLWPTTGEPDIGPQIATEFSVGPGKLHFFHVYRSSGGPSKALTLTFKKGRTW